MRQDIKLIRKQFRITRQEDNQIKEMMREQQLESFSEFLRQNLLKKESHEDVLIRWFTLWKSQKIEQISRDILQVTTLAEQSHQVTAEHLRIILTCVQELIAEVNQASPLSQDFRDKYMGG
ncbi:TPA: SAG1252 family conjugative relaxosome accessory protein [Streptococcus pneumoniae]|nr:Tn5252, Orf 10 protein [Streptococcus pneumoniae]VMI95577.1 Tn5252, Orf 10 protein [Streptococcus pneumoniae]VOB73510.1 Tn5252, Orf 10 protein [Streptococcus pneumoniae]VRS49917.1 Tn5252, Orf 10 protein [Streptococcus pneumoniae]VRZ80073.1 Tn5252, Orf 10 protein [Streptococcus pneumoniae]